MRRRVDEGIVGLSHSLSHRLPSAEVPRVRCRPVRNGGDSRWGNAVKDATVISRNLNYHRHACKLLCSHTKNTPMQITAYRTNKAVR
eukprot:7808614-Prorocentrum_lima.AAC.1